MKGESEIRIATEDDWEQIRSADYLKDPEKLKEKISRKEIIVCDDDGRITGMLRYMWFWDHIPFINFIWVKEDFRKAHRATRMIRELEKTTTGENCDRIMTSTQSDENAQNFYRKAGFTDAGGFTMRGQAFELILIKYL